MSLQEKRLYWVWAAMIQRCHNPRNKGHRNYGAKGIRVCDRWRSFDAFKADMGLPGPGLSLERSDSRGNYEPSNCRWATRKEQNSNRPAWCRYYMVNGERLTMKDAWSKYADTSVTYRSFVKRLVTRGWTIERAMRPVCEAR